MATLPPSTKVIPSVGDKGRQIYADLLDETRIRIDATRRLIEDRDSWVPRVLQGLCYLQFRMICENIAVGCLVAHGDIQDRKALKQWKIPIVMARMQELKPNFYPQPVTFHPTVPPGGLRLEENNVLHLTKDELVSLWTKSGKFLHRGTASEVLSQYGQNFVVDIDKMVEWGGKIIGLLERHKISSADGTRHIVGALASEDAGGKSMVWFAA